MKIEMKLKDARIQAGLTQEQVAEKIMVSRQTISNWENGKSLPDIVSIMNLSNLYQISIDELLKGDKRMKEKIEKDANVAKVRGRVLVTTAVIALGFGIIYSISIFTGGAFHEFCTGAIQWVMLGVGTACALTLLNIKNSDVE
ncbi:MAG: helix-turn-helix transcriptional regulator [Clostridia bacterium]|nr:helix-turn-helix transcriptional regulator [Clostridia bacterium]